MENSTILTSAITSFLTVIIALVSTRVYKSFGRVQIFADNVFNVILFNENGNTYMNSNNLKDTTNARLIEFDFTIEVFNKSEMPKVLRDISIGFHDAKKRLLFREDVKNLNDLETSEIDVNVKTHPILKTVNINARTILRYRLELIFHGEQFNNTKYIYFEYNDFGGRHHKKLIFTKIIA